MLFGFVKTPRHRSIAVVRPTAVVPPHICGARQRPTAQLRLAARRWLHAAVAAVTEVRPRRSALYLPGSNLRALEKARTLPTDVLLLDIEDAVAPDKKPLARGQIAEALAAGGYGRRELVVRVNGLASPWWADDVRAVAPLADAILIPKAESSDDVRTLSALAGDVCGERGLPPPSVWCMVETPRGVLRAEELAACAQVD